MTRSLYQDDDIKGYVKKILDEANLEEITMKTVCKEVYAQFPGHDLTAKKEFIKATVKSVGDPCKSLFSVSSYLQPFALLLAADRHVNRRTPRRKDLN